MRVSKRKVNRVVKESFWRGFQKGLGGTDRVALEYSSTSGYYSYNGIRQIAEKAGIEQALQVFDAYEKRRNEVGPWKDLGSGFRYEIPAKVWAEVQGEVARMRTEE